MLFRWVNDFGQSAIESDGRVAASLRASVEYSIESEFTAFK